MKQIKLLLLLLLLLIGINGESMAKNKLRYEKSPYLLQHADNPVNWYPWGKEAFNIAKKEDKPIFLSIGYSTCHWCHVMEHESFEDKDVAKLLNDTFISVKVDREERPDIDKTYMDVIHLMSGQGGWPLTIIMTPEKKPFYSATYIPKNSKFGRIGLMQLLPEIKKLWKNKRLDIEKNSEQIVRALSQSEKYSSSAKLSKQTLQIAYESFKSRFDENYGGFGSSPKFPSPHNIIFLLRYYSMSGTSDATSMAKKMAIKTLDHMRLGGIYDQIGYGFHRYSTDNKWLLPHFEKMLYDQAMLILAYSEGYAVTKNERYKKTVAEIFDYLKREMTSKNGGFYTAEDADSDGVEGRFYTWKEDDLKKILTKKEFDLFKKVYNLESGGNYLSNHTDPATNIPHLTSFDQIDSSILESARKKLFDHREKRINPHKDDKILTDQNGLMIAALAKAGKIFENSEYTKAAERAYRFISKNALKDNRLSHSYRKGDASVDGLLDDYSFMIFGLIELYQTTFDMTYLKNALNLNKTVLSHFLDKKNGGFFFSPDYGEKLLTNQKEIYDGATPSGNSVHFENLIRLSRITVDHQLESHAENLMNAFSNKVAMSPAGYTHFLSGLFYQFYTSYEIVIAGDKDDPLTKRMISAANKQHLPSSVTMLIDTGKHTPELVKLVPAFKYKSKMGGNTTAYICQKQSCKQPTSDVDKMLKMLNP